MLAPKYVVTWMLCGLTNWATNDGSWTLAQRASQGTKGPLGGTGKHLEPSIQILWKGFLPRGSKVVPFWL